MATEDKSKSQEQSEAADNETEEGDQLTAEELASISGGVIDPHVTAPDGTPWAPQHTGQGGGYGE